ncbi:PAS domain S-box protein [Aquincola sp. J276]|uniref:PAS domain S-box protein n=1 Tax=Aquincola sp. J276 TaxID=2898432 RepID=UPI002873DD0D|nr:PAS domain S-box protein [Aquincola sp. J276]
MSASPEVVPTGPRSTTLALLDGERRVLAQIAAGVPLPQVLEALACELEAGAPVPTKACVLVVAAGQLRVGAAPSLPPAVREALSAPAALAPGSTLAGLLAEAPRLARGDSQQQPLWPDAQHAARRYGLLHWCAQPILAADGRPLGMLVGFFRQAHDPQPDELDAFALAAQTAAMVLERHASEQQLREAEARHRQIVDSATDYAIVALDAQGRVTRWNEGARRMLGWREEDMLGHTLHRCFTPKDLAVGRIEREMASALAGHPSVEEGWRVRSDGSRIWASGQMTLLRGDGGQALGFVKVLRNRTQQRAAELRQNFLFELSESLHEAGAVAAVSRTVAARLGELLDVSRVGFGHLDEHWQLHIDHDWTDGSVASAVGLHALADYGEGLDAAVRAGTPVVVNDVRADPRTAGGAARHAHWQVGALMLVPVSPVSPMPQGAEGTVVFVTDSSPRQWTSDDVVLLREVSERLRLAAERARARDALRISEERLHIAQRAGSIGSFELYPHRGEVAVSASFCALWGLPETPRVTVAQLVALVHPDDVPLLAVDPDPTPQRLAYVEYRIRRADDGRMRWLARRGEVVADPPTGQLRYLGVCYDITERRQASEQLEASRQSLLLATDAAEIGTWDLDTETRELVWSPRTAAMFGLAPGKPASLAVFESGLHPDDRAATMAAFAAAMDPAQRSSYDVEYRTVGIDDGVLRWVAAKGKGLFDEGGRCVRAIGTAIDITARKHAEARQALLLDLADRLRPSGEPQSLLADALQMLRGFLGAHRAGLGRLQAECIVVDAEQTDGRTADHRTWPLDTFGEAPVAHWREGRTTVCEDITAEGMQPVLERFGVDSLVAVPLRGDGELRAIFYVAQHEARHWTPEEVALIEDVAARIWDAVERARAEQALRDETHALETLNRTAALLAQDFDIDTLVQRVVDAGTALTAARYGAFFYTMRDEQNERFMLYALSGAKRSDFEQFGMPRPTEVFAPTFRGDGVIRSADITQDPRYGRNWPHAGMPERHLPVRSYLAVPVVARSGDVLGCLMFGHPDADVFTERAERLACGLAAQAAIAIDNARLFRATQRDNETLEARVEERTRERDQVWALTEDLLAIADAQGQLQRVSASWTRQLGHAHAQLMLQPLSALVHRDDLPALHEALARMRESGQPVRLENRVATIEGDWRVMAWTLSPEPGTGRFVATGRDVTAERQRQAQLEEAQEALRQSQKMEAVGQLTGGIAHDFNNLLQGITGSLDLIKRRLLQGRSSDLDRFINGAMASAQRAAALTHRLLAFSRRQPLDPRPVAANPLVASMEDLLRRTLGEAVTLELMLAPELWLTMCDANQLESAILNLCINARDAMPGGGRLTIETANTSLDASYAVRIRDIAPGQYVCIGVSDTGTGMTPDVLARAFEPFFTTKPIGQGTGLGLSMIYGFARQSEGYVKIYSEPGHGTTVKLYLPRHLGQADDIEPSRPADIDHLSDGGQVVLVVEDEAVVRALVVDVLQELGYRALEAADGVAGLAMLQGPQPIDLLVTDIGLPGLNGRQMADAARVHRPDLKVLFMTGYAENAAVANGFLEPGMQMITKPFSMEVMSARLREMLAAGG